ncbi:MAG: HAD family hydrolase [Deltaproteobacteria bacterium]|nr:HAD family hydrolase [Deltaproteobacteria bacterium]
MTINAVIFDLFGTIVDGFAAASAGYQEQFAAALGIPNDELSQRWRQLTDRRTLGEFQTVEESIEQVCGLLGATITAEQMMKAVEVRLRLTRAALTPKADAIGTFKNLRANGLKIGLLSNCSIEIPIVWPETVFAAWFDSTVFSARERIKKPAREIYHIACNRLDVAPGDCLYVADGENFELAAAKEVGMQPVLIKSSESHSEVRREAREWQGPVISTLAQVIGYTNSHKV